MGMATFKVLNETKKAFEKPYKVKKKKSEAKWKMGVYKDGELVDFGIYDTKEEAEADFQNYDKSKGRTHIIEQE